MSYQVLARKWRPQHFEQLVGQEHVKTALINALTSSRLHHAYLFTGTRGVGKTTIARIFAKSLNCETGVTATPCGICAACQEIDAGNFVDLLEIDAASRTKVEDTRDLLDNVQYAPTRGRFKVYLIDEVHMLSRHSFNALLKTLEEPPPHVKFLLATTDPQKLPVTVLSRCLQFNLKALNQTQIAQHLAYILQQEKIAYEEPALVLLAKAAKGSLRDSLSLTDQAIAQSNANLTVTVIRDMLGYLEHNWAQDLLTAILTRDISLMQQQLTGLVSLHSDYAHVLDDMLSLLHLAALTQFSAAAAQLSEQAEFIQRLAAEQAAENLQLYYQLLISGKKELPFAPEPLIGLEMALLRAIAFVPSKAGSATIQSAQSPTPPVSTLNTQKKTAIESVTSIATVVPTVEETLIEPTAEQTLSENTSPSAAGIDPVVARIMARRGVTMSSAPATITSLESKAPVVSPQVLRDVPATIVEHGSPVATLSISKAEESYFDDVIPEAEHVAAEQQAEVIEPIINTSTAISEQHLAADIDDEDEMFLQAQQVVPEQFWQDYQQENTALTAESEPALPVTQHFDGVITEENFSIRFAAQVDDWAALIETLDTGGLSRLFLLNSSIAKEQGILTLTVAQSQQHLDNPVFREKLKQLVQQAFNDVVDIRIVYQPEVLQSPLAIQLRIEQERHQYLSRLLQQDTNVQQLQQLFQAQMLHETIKVS